MTLHVDAVFSDESHTSFTSSDSACSGSLSVSLGVSGVQLVGLSGFGHFGKFVWSGDEKSSRNEGQRIAQWPTALSTETLVT